jgi:hypothetical protein
VVKLYFKAEQLAKSKVEVILHLMAEALEADEPDATMAVHDAPAGRLILPSGPVAGIECSAARLHTLRRYGMNCRRCLASERIWRTPWLVFQRHGVLGSLLLASAARMLLGERAPRGRLGCLGRSTVPQCL